MKKSKLQQIIKEEIQNVLSEMDPAQQGFDAAMKRAGVETNAGGTNIQQSVEFLQGKRAYNDDMESGTKTKNPYTEPEDFAGRLNRTDTYAERSKKAKDWTLGYAAAMKRNPPPPIQSKQPDLSSYYKEKGSGGFTGD
jgi:hypothetical protein